MYSTTNLYTAAALATVGAQFRGMATNDVGRVVFLFNDPDGTLPDREKDFRRGRLAPVQARALIDNMMRLRDALYTAKGR